MQQRIQLPKVAVFAVRKRCLFNLNFTKYLVVLANVDPVGVSRAIEGLNPATTLVIVISKTFTTVETMLNARTLRKWITDVLDITILLQLAEMTNRLWDLKLCQST